MLLLVTLPCIVRGQFNYVTNDGTITITGYAGSSSTVTIPDMLDGIPVTGIGMGAFSYNTNLTTVVISNGIIDIGDFAFLRCSALTSVTLPESVAFIGSLAFAECARLPELQLGDGLAFIADDTFAGCTNLSRIVIGSGVTSIEEGAFAGCTGLTAVYFRGNAPSFRPASFGGASICTVFHLSNTAGWESDYAARPTAVWLPRILTDDGVGVRLNKFGFNITWANGMNVVVEASSNLANPVWTPIGTNTMGGVASRFSDPDWTNYPTRCYRVRAL